MNDLRSRFRNLDNLRAPDLWRDAHARAAAAGPLPGRASWVLILAALVLALLISGAALAGAGILTLPALVEQSVTPRPSAEPNPVPGWVAGSTMPTILGSPSTFIGDTTATLLPDGRALVVGGPRSELFDPATGRWTSTGALVQPRRQHVATLLADGRVLVVGGGADLDGETPSRSAELFDPTTQTWSATGSMLVARSAPTATLLLDGRVLVAGGASMGDSFAPSIASAELFDPATGTWSAAADMIVARVGHTATLLRDGRVLVAGGTTSDGWSGLTSAELFDPTTGIWTAAPDMATARAEHTATLLPNGQVLIVGMGSGELYDSTSNAWFPTGPTVQPNYADYPNDAPENAYETATLLPDGRVLVAGGGAEICCVPLTTAMAQLYDPSSRTWSRTESMLEPRGGHIAILLSDGRVLVVAGWSRDPLQRGSKSVARTVEFYTADHG